MAKGGHKKSHASKTETKKPPEVQDNKKHVAVDDTEDMNSGFGEYMRSGEGCIFYSSYDIFVSSCLPVYRRKIRTLYKNKTNNIVPRM